MTSTTAPIKKEETAAHATDATKTVENHKTAAAHHTEAAKHHTEAVKHHEDGNHAKAAESTVKAHGHAAIAHESQMADVKHHATKS